MAALDIIGNRLVIDIPDADAETPSQFFSRVARGGAMCREHGLKQVLYVRHGGPAPAEAVADLMQLMAGLGYAGCRIAVVVTEMPADYPLLFVEHLVAQDGIHMTVCANVAEADAFLDQRCQYALAS